MEVEEKKIIDVRVDVPEGVCGDWEIKRFTVSEDEARFHNLRETFYGGCRGRSIKSGDYTKIIRNGTLFIKKRPYLKCMMILQQKLRQI